MPAETISLIRSILIALGTILSTMGVMTAEQVGPLIEAIMTVVGGVIVIGTAIWGMWHQYLNRKAVAVATLTPVTPAAVKEAEKVLTVDEVKRAASPNLPPATVSATGALVNKPAA